MEKKIQQHKLKFSNFRFQCWCLVFIANCLLSAANCSAQSKITTFGIQVKPIFPVGFLGTGKQNVLQDSVNFSLALKSGYNFGMVIRKGFSELLSLELGINYVKRKYHIGISETGYSESSDFRVIGYEIPASLLVYIRLGQQIFMNASLGASCDMYASNFQSSGPEHTTLTVRNQTFQPAVVANLGWEYRTLRSGYFYLGASLHRPFDYELTTRIHYDRGTKEMDVYQPLSGSYLTIDLRYFFHEDPKKKKKKSSS